MIVFLLSNNIRKYNYVFGIASDSQLGMGGLAV
jgi:hypothetical protein